MGDHLINSHNLSLDSVWILLGENLSWSLLGLKGLKNHGKCSNCLRGGGVLLGIRGGGVPPGSPNPDPISDQKIVIFQTRFQPWPLKSIPVFRPGVGRNYVIIT